MSTFCTYYNQGICRSCDQIEQDYIQQIKNKEQKLLELLKELKVPALEKPVTSSTVKFRNKAKFSVTGTMDRPIIGLTGTDNLDAGRELLNCYLHVSRINEILPAVIEFIKSAKLAPYVISEKTGELKGLIVYYSEESREGYLRFILRSKESLDRIRKHLPSLKKSLPDFTCISCNIQPIPHAVLEGEEEIFFDEKETILIEAGKVKYFLSPKGFVQTNQKVAAQLYQTAADWVREKQGSRFLELFCGQGAFSFFVAPEIKAGLGIEINPDAIRTAQLTATRYPHLKFMSADAGQVETTVQEFQPDILLVNPPRRGIGNAVDFIIKSPAKYFLYSSCQAESLAADLKKLSSHFEIEKIQIFDMFPHTSHFETLVLLKRLF